MMAYENPFEDAHLQIPKEEMESIVLNETEAKANPTREESPLSSNQNPNPNYSDTSFLDPPSYADVVFSPQSIESNGHNSTISRSTSSSTSEFLKISVTNPVKEQEMSSSLVPGGTTYVTYLITSITNIPEYGGTEFMVRRRFKDVVTLADRLSENFRGFFVPVRPDKNVVESQMMKNEDFIDQRRAELEKYLCRLANHPVIKKSEELRVFLQVQGKLPLVKSTDVASRMLDGAAKLPKQLFGESTAGVIDPNEVLQPAKGGRDLLRIFKELKQSVTNDWSGWRPPVIEEDKEFLENKDKLQDLEQQLSNMSQQAESLVKAQQDIGETMGELGLALVKLTKFETEEAMYESQQVRANDMRNVATAAVKASRLYRELNSQTVKHLDKLHDYLGMMLAVNTAFSDRSSALLTVQTLSTELSSLHSKIEKLEIASSKIFGGDRSRLRKIEELKETISITEDAKAVAEREYERIKENNRNELERLEKEKYDDFVGMLKGFVINQVGYAEKMAGVWEKIAEETSGYAKDGS
ncbi:Sorting nexin Vps5-like, C-terminal [Dillenia turbinata]|uniref:Sorting nexin Vps5-like, C-terminal n=1 Tax=Dillenia turbinata TaxID=194707 RepID=A0AAN8VG85_9MAGN